MDFNCCSPLMHHHDQKDMSFFIVGVILTLVVWVLVSSLVINPVKIEEVTHKTVPKEKRMSTNNLELDLSTSNLFNDSLTNLPIDDGFINVMDCKVYYRRTSVPSGTTSKSLNILFLHGKSFTSANWQNIHTLSLMAAHGYHSVAIDLPKFGKTTGILKESKVKFIENVMKELHLNKPVVVSPSMSGEYSMEILKKNPNLISGLVAVAPVKTPIIAKEDYKNIKVPTLIVYGTKDNTGLAEVSKEHLKHLPYHYDLPIMNAGHAAYLDQPKIFHRSLYAFLSIVPSYKGQN